jgi:hypothetical protein
MLDSFSRPRPHNVVHGTSNLYGYGVGILMIEGYFPRPPGAIGNATTFPFPVLHRVVKGATGTATVRVLSTYPSDSPEFAEAIAPWINGARDLEAQGVRAITTSCGFSALFQRELAMAVEVPVFATSLLLVPFIARMLKPGGLVGVITADARMLTPRHFEGAGIDPATVAVAGLEGCAHFEEMAYQDRHDVDLDRLNNEVVAVTRDLVRGEPRIRALLLECSLLPPFAGSIQDEIRLPVFDFTHMIAMVHTAVVRQPFVGFV